MAPAVLDGMEDIPRLASHCLSNHTRRFVVAPALFGHRANCASREKSSSRSSHNEIQPHSRGSDQHRAIFDVYPLYDALAGRVTLYPYLMPATRPWMLTCTTFIRGNGFPRVGRALPSHRMVGGTGDNEPGLGFGHHSVQTTETVPSPTRQLWSETQKMTDERTSPR